MMRFGKWSACSSRRTRPMMGKVIFIPLMSFYAISEHEAGMQQIFDTQQAMAGHAVTKPAEEKEEEKHYLLHEDGTFELKLPKEEWIVTRQFW